MKNYFNKLLLSLVITLLGILPNSFAQFSGGKLDLTNPDQVHVIILKSGKRIKGSIVSIINEAVTLQPTDLDATIEYSLSEIRNIRVKGNILKFDKNFDSKFPPTLSLFFTNTAFAMKKGEKSYRTFWGNSMQYSKQSGKGFEWGLGISSPLFITGKLKFTGASKNEKSRHGFQFSSAIFPTPYESALVVEVSQVNTWGNEDRFFNLTFNYYEIKVDQGFNSFLTRINFPERYFSVAFGGGIRLGENLQLHLNKNINFNEQLIDANLLPSFGISWKLEQHNIGFGYMSNNNLGFNSYPVFDFDFDETLTFTEGEFSKLPFLSYSRIF